MEKDLPTLREIVGGTWKKEEELKAFKSEVAALDRKIQLELAPPPPEQVEPARDIPSGDITDMSDSIQGNIHFVRPKMPEGGRRLKM